MKKFIPLLILSAIVIVFFRQFFVQNLLPIPSDTIVGLYNPFRDVYAEKYPRGVPFKNFLITDPIRQQYPWRIESVLQEKLVQLPLWNPYNFSGTPLLANGQSAALYPFNLLFFLLPFPLTWSILIFLQQLLGGIFLYLYLRNLKLHIAASVLGSIAFIFSGFFVAWLEWGTVDMVVIWLPLMLLCIDKIFTGQKYKVWAFMYLVTLVFSFLAGHLQTFFYVFLVQGGYILLNLFGSKKKRITISLFVLCSLLFAVITSIQWIPLLQFILLSGRETDLIMGPGWFFPLQHLITFFVPDFFGNPTTLNYWGIWNYAELTGYISIPALLFSFLALYIRKEKKVWFFVGIVAVSFLFALPTFLAFLPSVLHIPFLATAQPTRLLVLIDFSLVVLAAFGMDDFLTSSKKISVPIVLLSAVFLCLWTVLVLHTKFLPTISLENIDVAKRNIVFPTIIFTLTVVLLAAGVFFRKSKKTFMLIIWCIVLVTMIDGFRFADKFTPFTKEDYLFPSTKTLSFLQKNAGISRIMETDSQILPPNFSLLYHLQSVDGYDPLYIKAYGEFVIAMERDKPDIDTPFGFNRIITPQNFESRLTDVMGVKYILSFKELTSTKLKKVFQEGQTITYENTNAYPRAFFVKNVTPGGSQQDEANFLFDMSKNLRTNAIALNIPKNTYVSLGSAIVNSYSPKKVSILTKNASYGFLVLADAFYPTWHAYIDGKETHIYPTDLAFRGIFVPKGEHTIEFRDELF